MTSALATTSKPEWDWMILTDCQNSNNERAVAPCPLYSITTNRAAIAELFRVNFVGSVQQLCVSTPRRPDAII
jgi:hypothetical protein